MGIGTKSPSYKLIRIDLNDATIYEYTPRREGNIPSTTLLRTSKIYVIEQFLQLESAEKEDDLLAGSFLEIKTRRRRRFNLPDQLPQYNAFIADYLARTKLYRRSTAYFNSGVLKLYEEPLLDFVKNEGEIRLLMDWQGFTSKRDVQELLRLHDPDHRSHYIKRTLQHFLENLEDKAFSSTQLLAEFVRLDILKIKMVKMEGGKGIYHKKTGILTDPLGNSIQHEGSDNFTLNAHANNAESVTFLYGNEP